MTIRSTATQPATSEPITGPSFAVISGTQAFNEENLNLDLRSIFGQSLLLNVAPSRTI